MNKLSVDPRPSPALVSAIVLVSYPAIPTFFLLTVRNFLPANEKKSWDGWVRGYSI